MNPSRKTNVTLWKNRDASNDRKNVKTTRQNTSTNKNIQPSNVESDFISNLKKQIYFMEMELKLMKEREKEINKSGGLYSIIQR